MTALDPLKLLAALSLLAGSLVYLASVFRRQSHPSLGANLVLAGSVALVLVSGNALGATLLNYSLMASLTNMAAVVALGWSRGVLEVRMSRLDRWFLVLLALAVAAWGVTGSAWVALVAASLAGMVGTTMVLTKLLRCPGSESALAWALITMAYTLPLMGAQPLKAQDLVFALPNVVLCAAIAILGFSQNRRGTAAPVGAASGP